GAFAADRPLLGIGLMFGFCALAPIGDALAKVLGETVPLIQLLLARFMVQAIVLAPLAPRGGRTSRRVLRLIWTRTVLHILGIGAMFTSLRFLPLADAVAIAFVMPFIMLLLGRYVLDEVVGPRRLAACAVGFIGTMLVVQPSFAEVGAPALLPLFVAVLFAGFMLVTRQVAKEIDPIRMQFISGLMASAMLLPLFLIGAAFAPHTLLGAVVPGGFEAGLLLLIGVLGTVAHLLMTWSLRFAPSATVAPMQYLEIPFATLVGWMIFHELPNGLAAIGILITCAAGLYIIARERAVSRL
ncbi:MAG: DMT family transporter, partial [Pseudomonadota bacterium]